MIENQNSPACSNEDLLIEIRGLKRKLTLAEANLARAKLVDAAKNRAERILNDSFEKENQYFNLILQNTVNIVLLLDCDRRFAYVSDTFFKVSEIDNLGFINGLYYSDVLAPIMPEGNLERFTQTIDAAVIQNTTVSIEDQIDFNCKGDPRTYSIVVTPMVDEDGKNTGIMALFNDITKINDAMEIAKNASLAKSNFLANMSHEIRTPMNAIIGMTSIGKTADDKERKNYCLDKIEDASKHLLGVINDILDMSKIEANKLDLSPVDFEFEAMLRNVTNIIHFRLDEKKQRFYVNIDDSIPQLFFGDDQRLAQVITNLLSNSVKFTPEEGAITLDAKLLSEDGENVRLQISVTDTGIGMTDEQKGRLFNSFEQAEAGTSRKYGGTGLGLAITKRIVELMDGEIWVESEPGQGTKFIFTILLKHSFINECLDTTGKDVDLEKENEEIDFTGHKILLAEDVEINREIVLALLEPTHLMVDCAENGSEAVLMFKESSEDYSMIFMDLQMPEMDGYEATRQIRTLDLPRADDIPIIAMTANVFREDVEKCLEAGMHDHIGKPLDFVEVMKVLKKYLLNK